MLLGGGVYGIENINSAIDSLPSTRFTLIVLPLKITGGSGSPARIIAVLD